VRESEISSTMANSDEVAMMDKAPYGRNAPA
jgi:hypothetical protein